MFSPTQLNGLSCFEGMESDPGNCCLLIPWEGAQVGLEEFQAVASLPCCLLNKEQTQVWDCIPRGNLMCLLSSKSSLQNVICLFSSKRQKQSFPAMNNRPWQWKHRVLTSGPPGNSQKHFLQYQKTAPFPFSLPLSLDFPLVSLSLAYASTAAHHFSPPHSYWRG